MPLIGLDIGTTGCKAALFDEDGTLLGSASSEYAVDMPHPTWAEQDAERVWALAQDTLRLVIAETGVRDVDALGLSVQGEAIMPVDADGHALRPAILGMDTRTEPQNAWLRERFGARALFDQTGMPVHTINTLPKLLWLKEHEPDVWANAARFLLYEDFIINKMTGKAVISQCLASRTQLYPTTQPSVLSPQSSTTWSPEILDTLDLAPTRLAEIRPSGYAVGEMHASLAHSLGLRKPPLIVTGGHDQACGALGVGLVQPGQAMVSTGTAEVVEVAMASPALNETLYDGNISVYAHTAPGLYVAMTLNHSGGLLLRWWRDEFCQSETRHALATGQDPYNAIFSLSPSLSPSSLLILPHFAGSGTPTFDTASKGAILGLTFNTTKADIAQAILEGLTYELRVNLDLLKEGGVTIDELRAIGGGAKSDVWLHLKADITGIPVVVPRVTEAACWGAALLAGAGASIYPDVAQAAAERVYLERRIEPDAERYAQYSEQYALYQDVYPAVREIQGRM